MWLDWGEISRLLSVDLRPRQKIVKILEFHFGSFGVDKRWPIIDFFLFLLDRIETCIMDGFPVLFSQRAKWINARTLQFGHYSGKLNRSNSDEMEDSLLLSTR